MNFHSCEKQIFKSFGCTKIRNKSNKQKRAETKPQTATIHYQFFLTMFRQVLAIPLLTEEALFT